MTEDTFDDVHERPPHTWVRRRKSFQDWVTTTGGVVAIVSTIVAGGAWLLDAAPFVKADTYRRDKMATDLRVQGTEDQLRALTNGQAAIQRNGLLTLQLQLKGRVELIDATMVGLSRTSPTYLGLQAELNSTQQQLDEVGRQLNR